MDKPNRFYKNSQQRNKKENSKNPYGKGKYVKPTTYYDHKKDITTPIPDVNDKKAVIIHYLWICIQKSYPKTTKKEVERIWDYYDQLKKVIITHLEQYRKEYSKEGNQWKLIAYAKAINTIRASKVPIASGRQAKNLPNIGDGISEKIDYILLEKKYEN